jgi:hypothetical protein
MTTLFTALCLLLLGLAFFYFVRYLCAHGPICIPWTHVSSVDEDGKQVGRGRWVRTPRPDRIDRNGLNHIVKYVARLVKSQSDNAHLIISSTDGNKASLVCRDKGHLKIIEMVYTGSSTPTKRKEPFSFPPHPPDVEKEQAIRNLFAELGITAEKDFVHEYNGYVDAMRDLHYPIGNDIAPATLTIQRLLREVYHIRDTDGLDFTFEE